MNRLAPAKRTIKPHGFLGQHLNAGAFRIRRRAVLIENIISNGSLCKVDGCNKKRKKKCNRCSMHESRLFRTGRLDKITPIEKIFNKAKRVSTGCIEYQGYTNRFGYGRCRANGKKVLVHRYVYEQLRGEIPADMMVCHTCDNPCCINIDHLWIGTSKDNFYDAIKKNRINPAERAIRRWKTCPTLRRQV